MPEGQISLSSRDTTIFTKCVEMILSSNSLYKLRRGHDHIRPLDFRKNWVFEKVEKADFLRYTLASVLLSLGNLNRLSKSLFGLIPENSLLDKCPYYRYDWLETGLACRLPCHAVCKPRGMVTSLLIMLSIN